MHCRNRSDKSTPKYFGGAMTLRVCGMFLSLLLLGVQLAAAQVRQVTGRVTNSESGEGLPEATISVTGTRIVAQTGPDGRYTMNAPDGQLALVIRAIGFKRADVTVPPDQATADAA